MGLPAEFFPMIWPMVLQTVSEATGGLDLNTLRPVDNCSFKQQPALFIHGTEDEMISLDHTERNFEKYGCSDKSVAYCSGTHNDFRSNDVIT